MRVIIYIWHDELYWLSNGIHRIKVDNYSDTIQTSYYDEI